MIMALLHCWVDECRLWVLFLEKNFMAANIHTLANYFNGNANSNHGECCIVHVDMVSAAQCWFLICFCIVLSKPESEKYRMLLPGLVVCIVIRHRRCSDRLLFWGQALQWAGMQKSPLIFYWAAGCGFDLRRRGSVQSADATDQCLFFFCIL